MSHQGTKTSFTPYRDIRDFLSTLEAKGKLRRIQKEVDHTWELSCLARWMYQGLPAEQRFGLLFENIKDFTIPVMTGVLGASPDTYAIALQTPVDQINQKWMQSLDNPIPSQEVRTAVSQEVVYTGEQVDLGKIPIPTWTPGKDVGPYLTGIVISKDSDSGIQNMSTYRSMVVGKNRLNVNIAPGRHGRMCYDSYMRKKRPAPFAWVVGAEPVVHFATIANVPYGVDEMVVAGGLKGMPVEVVKAKTVDLLVPANAEFIIEGEFLPGEEGPEGPFGEFAGYMGPVWSHPIARITTITHRKNPLYYGYISQMPPSESTVIQSLSNAGVVMKMLLDMGYKSVKDVYIDLTFGGTLAHCIVSMKPLYPNHAKRVGRCVANETTLKRVTVVDEDVDIRDQMHMDWAMNSRMNAQHDVMVIDKVFTAGMLDPTVPMHDGEPEPSSKLVIDATEKPQQAGAFSAFSIPSKDLMMRALESWKAIGLPEFTISKRTHFMLDHK